MNISSNSLYGTSSYATYGSSTSSSSSLSSKFAEALLTSLDSDSSGSVDSAEFSSAALELSSDTSAINDAFSSLDSNKDGSITIDELTSMLSAQSTMTSGSMPPPPPSSSQGKEDNGKTKDELTAMAEEVSSTDSNLASLLSSVAENFDAADANSDGKVTSAEAMAYQQSTQETSASGTDASNVAASGSMPPPPPPPSSSSREEDTGYTKDELTAMASETSSTDSNLSSLFETLAQNFDAADTNSDGKVTSSEAQAYKDSTRADSIGVANATTESSNDSLMKALLAQIISNYATQNTLSSSSVSFSA